MIERQGNADIYTITLSSASLLMLMKFLTNCTITTQLAMNALNGNHSKEADKALAEVEKKFNWLCEMGAPSSED